MLLETQDKYEELYRSYKLLCLDCFLFNMEPTQDEFDQLREVSKKAYATKYPGKYDFSPLVKNH